MTALTIIMAIITVLMFIILFKVDKNDNLSHPPYVLFAICAILALGLTVCGIMGLSFEIAEIISEVKS